MELPVYRMPRWNNVAYSMYDRSKAFVLQAGKVIIAVSVILWVLASYGPGDRFAKIEQKHTTKWIRYENKRTGKSHCSFIADQKLRESLPT